MYILDTNAFYYAADISQFTYDVKKLRKLIVENDTFISSTSIYEFLTKYREDLPMIHKGGRFIRDNDIQIAVNKVDALSEEISWELWSYSKKQLAETCKKVLTVKVENESSIIAAVFDLCLFSGFYFSAYATGNEPSPFCQYVLTAIYKMFLQINTEVIRELFKEGYKGDNCEKDVRDGFYNLLDFELRMGIPYIEKAKEVIDEDGTIDVQVWLDSEDFETPTKEIAKQMCKKTSTKYLQSLGVIYKKNNNDPYLEKHLNRISGIINKRILLHPIQEYFYDTLDSIVTSGAALLKNDFLDALIMCNIQDEHIFITYDNGVIKRLEKRKEQYPKYKDSLDEINRLKQE